MSSNFIVKQVDDDFIITRALEAYAWDKKDLEEIMFEREYTLEYEMAVRKSSRLSILDEQRDLFNILRFVNETLHKMLDMFGENIFLAGGFYKDILNERSPKDIDFFFTDEEAFQQASSYLKSLIPPKTSNQGRPKFPREISNSDNAESYQTSGGLVRVEIVKKEFNDIETTLNRFDFTVTKVAFFKKDGKLFVMIHKDTENDILKKLINFDNLEKDCARSLVKRVLRYQGYGYRLTDESAIQAVSLIKGNTSPEHSPEEIIQAWKNRSELETSKPFRGKKRGISIFYDFASESPHTNYDLDPYAGSYDATRDFRRYIKTLMYGFDKVDSGLKKEIQQLPELDPFWREKVSSIMPELPVIELIKKCNTYGDLNKTSKIVELLASPVSFTVQRKSHSSSNPPIFDCCGIGYGRIDSEHAPSDTSFFVGAYGGVRCGKRRGHSFNRNSSAEVIMLLIDMYGIDDTIRALTGIYSRVFTDEVPLQNVWEANIKLGVFTPDMDVNLFLDLVKGEKIDDNDLWAEEEAEQKTLIEAF